MIALQSQGSVFATALLFSVVTVLIGLTCVYLNPSSLDYFTIARRNTVWVHNSTCRQVGHINEERRERNSNRFTYRPVIIWEMGSEEHREAMWNTKHNLSSMYSETSGNSCATHLEGLRKSRGHAVVVGFTNNVKVKPEAKVLHTDLAYSF